MVWKFGACRSQINGDLTLVTRPPNARLRVFAKFQTRQPPDFTVPSIQINLSAKKCFPSSPSFIMSNKSPSDAKKVVEHLAHRRIRFSALFSEQDDASQEGDQVREEVKYRCATAATVSTLTDLLLD